MLTICRYSLQDRNHSFHYILENKRIKKLSSIFSNKPENTDFTETTLQQNVLSLALSRTCHQYDLDFGQ